MSITVPELQTTTRRRTLGPQAARWILILGLAGVFGGWVGGQYLAYRFAYHPNLGPSLLSIPTGMRGYVLLGAFGGFSAALYLLFRRGRRALAIPFVTAAGVLGLGSLGPVYSPFQLVRWAAAYRGVLELAPAISDSILVVAVSAIAGATSALILIDTRPRRRVSSSHGSARWGSGEVLRGSEGLLIGRELESRELLRFDGEGHLLTLAPTRSGKGVSAVIPNLLDYPGSMLVLDVKPENAAVAARRRRELGQDVRILDPFGVVEGWDAFNPLDLIDTDGPDAIDDARMIADMMVTVDERAENVHWNETGARVSGGSRPPRQGEPRSRRPAPPDRAKADGAPERHAPVGGRVR